MKQQLSAFWKKNNIYLLAFLLPVLIMMTLFIIGKIFPFGDRSFLHLDMYHQYYPFLTEFYRKIKEGESLLYSFHTGIGANFLGLYVYYLASPFNWLALLVPEQYLIEFMSYLVIFRIGLCGLTFSCYLRHHFRTKHYAIVFFSIFYALSGYMAAYNWNVMWLDCIILAPLIILGLERLVKEGKGGLYCITLALAILSNYYICIMICIYLVLYFVVLIVSKERTSLISACLRFALYSLLAGGMACVLLLPELEVLSLTAFSNSSFPQKLTSYFPLFDVISRHFADIAVETRLDHWPNIYCGVAVLFFLPLYVINRNIGFREKLAKCVLMAFLLISFSTNTLNFIWHGFNYPDSLPARQSFLYIFLLLTVCFESFLHIRDYSKKELAAVFGSIFFFLLLTQKLVTDDALTVRSLLITSLFLLVYGTLLNLYLNEPRLKKYLILYTTAAVILEAGLNTGLTSVPTVSRSDYLAHSTNSGRLAAQIQETDTDFYRIEKFSRLTQNDGTLAGYPTASFFSSTATALTTGFYENYGMQDSRVYYCFNGATPLTSALLSVKYMISPTERTEDPLLRFAGSEGENAWLYENKYTLPAGYTVDSSYENLSPASELGDLVARISESNLTNGLNPIAKQNKLAARFYPKEPLFSQITVRNGDTSSAAIKVTSSAHIYAYIVNHKVPGATVYRQNETQSFKKLKNPYILDLGYQNAGTILEIASDDPEQNLSLIAYSLNEAVLDKVLDAMTAQPFTVTGHTSDSIVGTADIKKAGHMVFSIPYETGWRVWIDGEEASEYNLFEDCFLSVPIGEGHHSIELRFYPRTLNIGIAMSLVSLAAFLLCMYLCKRTGQQAQKPDKQKA